MALQRKWVFWICTILLVAVLPFRGSCQSVDSGGVSHLAKDSGSRPSPTRQVMAVTASPQDSAAARLVKLARDSARRAVRLQAARRARTDSLRKSDSLGQAMLAVAFSDSLRKDSLRRDTLRAGTVILPVKHPVRPSPTVITREGVPKIRISRDLLFYAVLCMLLWIGILKSGYEKYFNDLFTVFFRSSLRQHQIREQLLQARLPSLLFNLFFVGCAGTFLYLLASGHTLRIGVSEWQLWLASIASVALLYSAKFVGLKLSGWIFGMTGATDTYIFIIFLVNKILGVALLPIVILLAFSREPLESASATLGILLVLGMLIYRFIRSYRPVWEEVQISRFHFFLYLCAFEIAPLLLIYKSMLKLL